MVFNLIKRACIVLITFVGSFSYTNVFSQGVVSDGAERNALMAIYTTLGDSTWTKKWTLSQIQAFPDSTLHGVIVTNGDIVKINLSSNKLIGTLPSAFNDLTELQELILSNNKLSGTLPDMSALTKLTKLDLSGHEFTGAIPSWIGFLSSLEELYLSAKPGSSGFSSIPEEISGLTKLEKLVLDNNNLSQAGSIPNTFNQLDNLYSISMRLCHLTAQSVSGGFNGLNGLFLLDLSYNDTFVDNTQFPDKLSGMPHLNTLVLMDNGFDSFPVSITQLPFVTLDLSHNDYSSETRLSSVIDQLKDCSHLVTLDLTSCRIKGLPSDFDELKVKKLILSANNDLDEDKCEELGGMPDLTELFILNCGLDELPSGLTASSTLKILDASNNSLNTAFEVIQDIANLEVLILKNNTISELDQWFGSGSAGVLKELNLSFNPLTTVPSSIIGYRRLEKLSINNAQLNGSWPAEMDSLKTVRVLDLSHNDIDTLPDLTLWLSLQEVDLEANELTGTIPRFLTQKTSPKTIINISSNMYTGVDTVGFFNKPVSIDVASNQLTFEDIIAFQQNMSGYAYSPQAVVDETKEVYSFAGGTLTLRATVDTARASCTYRWYKVSGTGSGVFIGSGQSLPLSNMTAADEGNIYYYTIQDGVAKNLTLKSHNQILVFSCKGMLSQLTFSAKRHLCAMNFKPAVQYAANCRSISYQWNFGDESSSTDRSPWHGYANEGTYTVTMKVKFECGPCQADTTVTKQVKYTLPQQLISDSIISVTTDKKLEILNVSAATFSDSWFLHSGSGMQGNSFLNGQQGVWRNEGSHVYDTLRLASNQTNIAKDGTFELNTFNWQAAEINLVPGWIKANSMTQYSPYSYELENRDVLGIYSSALYDYGGHLPSANGVNMRNNEMAFSGFEYFEENVSGNLVLSTTPVDAFTTYVVREADEHIAVVEAPIEDLQPVDLVDVKATAILGFFYSKKRNNFIEKDQIICLERHPDNPNWTLIVLRDAPFTGLWTGQIKVKNQIQPVGSTVIENTISHTGKSSLKITTETSVTQDLLQLDSAKRYFINVWVSINNPHVTTPFLANGLGLEVTMRSQNGTVLDTTFFEPSGQIIEGWQQIRGSFTSPDDKARLTLTFKNGDAAAVWFDDLRFHPENGNMKSYVYSLTDYRLQAILDEENFATFYFYDAEGNLQTVKKETERGIKTISENISYQVQR